MAGAVVDSKDLGGEPQGKVSVGPAPTNIVDPADLGRATPAPALNLAPGAAAPASGNQFYNQIARQIGLTGRGIVQGITDLPLALNDLALQYVQNPIMRAIGANNLVAAPSMQTRDALLDKVTPTPQGGVENVVNQGVRAMSSVIPSVGAANTIANTAASPVTRNVAGQLAAAPGTQVAAAGTGAVASETARQGFDIQNPLALMGINLAAGTLGGATASRLGNVNMGSIPLPGGGRFEINPGAGTNYADAATGNLVQNARREGVELSAADVAPNSRSGRLVTGLRKAGEVQDDRALNTTNQVVNMIERQTENARPVGPNASSADRVVADDLRLQYKFATKTAKGLYDSVDTALKAVPGSERMSLATTQNAANDLFTTFPDWTTLTSASQSLRKKLEQVATNASSQSEFKDMRALSKEVGLLVDATRMDPKLAAVNGKLKNLYGAIQQDADIWSSTTTNKAAANAYKAANNYFKENVAPFRDDPTIYRTVSSRTPTAEFDKGAQKITERIIGSGEETTRLATSLMSPKGQEAFRFKLLENSRERAVSPDNATYFSAPGYQREMNLGRTDTPTANRIVMGTDPRALAQAEQTQAIVDATRGALSPKVQPKTGIQLLPTANRATNAGAGAGFATLLGLDPTVGAVIGAIGAPAVAQAFERGLTSRAGTDFLLGNPYRPGFGLLNPLPPLITDPRNTE